MLAESYTCINAWRLSPMCESLKGVDHNMEQRSSVVSWGCLQIVVFALMPDSHVPCECVTGVYRNMQSLSSSLASWS